MAKGGRAHWTGERSAAGDRSPWLIAGIVSFATFMEVLDTTIAIVSLDHIAGSLSATYEEATWVITSYLIANAIAVPISAWLSNIVGRKRFYMLSVALFTFSSFLCGIAPNLTFLILARILQGLGGGGLAPSEQSLLTQTFPPAQRGGAFALYGLVIIVAPIVGPVFGGYITETYSWHWVFLINVPVGLVSLWLTHRFVVDPPKIEEERKERLKDGIQADWIGIVLLVLWLGLLEFTLDRGQREDWLESPMIATTLMVSVTAALMLFVWEWHHPRPVFDVRLYRSRTYSLAILTMTTTGVLLLGMTQLVPQFLQQVLGYSAVEAGRAMTLGGVASLLTLPFAGMLTGKVQPKYLMMFGLASEALAIWWCTNLTPQVDWWWAALARTWVSLGLAFLFIPINATADADVPEDKTPDASAQLNLARYMGGSFAIALAQSMIEQRSQHHQSRLVETLTPGDPGYVSWLEQTRAAVAGATDGGDQAAIGTIYAEVTHQAVVLAYTDVFWVLAVVVACVTPLLFFMRKLTKAEITGT